MSERYHRAELEIAHDLSSYSSVAVPALRLRRVLNIGCGARQTPIPADWDRSLSSRSNEQCQLGSFCSIAFVMFLAACDLLSECVAVRALGLTAEPGEL